MYEKLTIDFLFKCGQLYCLWIKNKPNKLCFRFNGSYTNLLVTLCVCAIGLTINMWGSQSWKKMQTFFEATPGNTWKADGDHAFYYSVHQFCCRQSSTGVYSMRLHAQECSGCSHWGVFTFFLSEPVFLGPCHFHVGLTPVKNAEDIMDKK